MLGKSLRLIVAVAGVAIVTGGCDNERVFVEQIIRAPRGLLLAVCNPALVIGVPEFVPPSIRQPPLVWMPSTCPVSSRITGEPELPPVVSTRYVGRF